MDAASYRFCIATDFYPTSGNRADNSGGLVGVGLYGYSWSGSPYSASNARGSGLHCTSGLVYPEISDLRAFGFPVRCVQE